MTWEIASVVTVMGTAITFLYLSLALPEEKRGKGLYLFREWTRIGLLIMAFLLLLSNFFITYEIVNPQNAAIGSIINRWYIYTVVFVVVLFAYLLIRMIIESAMIPKEAFDEMSKTMKKTGNGYGRY